MPEGIIKLEQKEQKEKLLLRIFSRSCGLITSHTYETSDELLKKFFSPESKTAHYTGCDEFDQPVEHYFELEGKGDIAGVVIVPLKNRKVLPVEAQAAPGPMMPPRRPN